MTKRAAKRSAKRILVRPAAKGRKAEYYTPHADDHEALTRPCPTCPAPIGAWCGGLGDVHEERIKRGDRAGAHYERAHCVHEP